MAEGTTNRHVLVTGASGFLGRHVVRALAERGMAFRAAVRVPGREAGQVEVCHMDVTDPSSVKAAMEGVDAVVHLVAIIRERGNHTFDAVNHLGTANVVEAAKEAGVGTLVHLSAVGVTDSPEFPYLRSKWMGEQAVIGGGVPYTILRGSTLFGPGDEFIGTLAALAKAFPLVPVPGSGRTVYQPIHVQDMARCVIEALERPDLRGQTLDLGGPHHLTYDQIIDIIAGVYALRRVKLHVPLTVMRGLVGVMERVVSHPPATLHQLRMLSLDSVTEVDSVERTFGFQPQPLEDSIGYIRGISYWKALRTSLGFPPRRGPDS